MCRYPKTENVGSVNGAYKPEGPKIETLELENCKGDHDKIFTKVPIAN